MCICMQKRGSKLLIWSILSLLEQYVLLLVITFCLSILTLSNLQTSAVCFWIPLQKRLLGMYSKAKAGMVCETLLRHSTTMWTKFLLELTPSPLEWTVVNILHTIFSHTRPGRYQLFNWLFSFKGHSTYMCGYYQKAGIFGGRASYEKIR